MMRWVWVGGVGLCGMLAPSLGQAQLPPAARLDAAHVAAAAQSETLLHVMAPGRFSIAAHSSSGAALDLVDMITGPTDRVGDAGTADGRLDLLLDTGTYKVRAFSAPGAHGDVALHVLPFLAAGPTTELPLVGQADAMLGDVQQQSFWLNVAQDQPVRVEAAGRALADLRLWRNGRQLVAAMPDVRMIEPEKNHPLRDLLISTSLPAGRYLVTAYGGPALPWADGTAAMPFHLRTGLSAALRPGWVGGSIGPFGNEVFAASGADDFFALSTDGPATLTVDDQMAFIAANNRVPRATLQAVSQQADHVVQVQGQAGAPYQVQATMVGSTTQLTQAGDYWVTVNTSGMGGDEVPATLILARRGRAGLEVAASNAPEIGAGAAWRRRFSLGGPVSVLFHAPQGGEIAALVAGLPVLPPWLMALDTGATVPPKAPGAWNIPAGWYALGLAPQGNAAGVADLTIGAPGATASIGQAGPAAPTVSFGVQHVEWRGNAVQTLTLFSNAAPGAQIGMDARLLPVDLNGSPLRVSQLAGQGLDIPVGASPWKLAAVEIGHGPVAVSYVQDLGVARLPAPDHDRVVALYRDLPPGLEMPSPAGAPTAWPVSAALPQATPPVPPPAILVQAGLLQAGLLQAGVPGFFDLRQDQERDFELRVDQGGLYRVETLGRLRTKGAIGTDFVPALESGEANGIGQNMLLQGWLRAGQYHVSVTAEDSAGHAGLVAAPAPLQTSATLLPGGSVRASLAAGAGLAVPIDITVPGSYQLDLLGLAHRLTARLEDAGGWPLAASSEMDSVTQDLAPGRYKLLVSPEAVDARAVVRLRLMPKPVTLAGHGPHALPFDAPQSLAWREPAGRDDARVPDDWRFTLAGPADITLSITDGMEAVLLAADGKQKAHIVGGTPFHGSLAAGAYSVEARSQGRNDRLDYTLSLSATQLQPDTPRSVTLPAQVPFALARDQVVSLTSFGATPVRATLRDASGHTLGRFGARDDDWNIAISRLLPAGAYTLDLASAAPPGEHRIPRNKNDAPARRMRAESAADEDGAGNGENEPEPYQAQTGETVDNGDAHEANTALTELTLSLPQEVPVVAFTGSSIALPGGGVHRLTLPAPKAGQLILAGAASTAALEVSLERLRGTVWQSVATAQGLAPIVAVPAAGVAVPAAGGGAWRLAVWPVDGGAPPIRVAARLVDQPLVAASGPVQFTRIGLPGVADDLVAAHAAMKSRALLALAGDAGAVLAGDWPEHAATPPSDGMIAPQAQDFWLVAPHAVKVSLLPLASGVPVTLTLPAGARAVLPHQDRLTAWIAEAPSQPGLSGGIAMGVAAGSALTMMDPPVDTPVTVWNAGDDDALRVTARPVALAFNERHAFDAGETTLPALSATLIRPPVGEHRFRLDLPPGTAAVASSPTAATVWAGREAVSRTLEGGWREIVLVNTNAVPATINLAMDDLATAPAAVRPDLAVKRFFGANGSLDLPVTAQAGQTLITAGDASATFVGDNGMVLRGPRLTLPGAGRVILEHGIGLAAMWLEGAGAAPWASPKPVAVTLPQTLPLTGPAMQFNLAPAQAGLLRVRSSAPVILALNSDTPKLFPAGAAASFYLPAGNAQLRVVAPQDGALSGTLELTETPLRAAVEGLGRSATLAPGDAVAFGFTLRQPTRIGVGVRAQPDRAELSLLDAQGHELATGAAMLRDLPAGDYVLLAQIPPDAPTTVLQPALIGLVPRPNGPPPDIIEYYRALAGLVSKDHPRD